MSNEVTEDATRIACRKASVDELVKRGKERIEALLCDDVELACYVDEICRRSMGFAEVPSASERNDFWHKLWNGVLVRILADVRR